MSLMDMFLAMGGGNPGAIQALIKICEDAPKIDPDDFANKALPGEKPIGLGPILHLDSNGIYEHRIWMLYKDVCNFSTTRVIGLLRAVQLGLLKPCKLDYAIDNHGQGLNIDGTLRKVKEKLANFNMKAEGVKA
jgi:hypothetical protein